MWLVTCFCYLLLLPVLQSYEFFSFGPGFQVVEDKSHSPVVPLIELEDTKKMYMPWGKTLQHIPVTTSHCIDRKHVTVLTATQFAEQGYHIDDKHWWIHDLHLQVFRKSCWAMVAHLFPHRYFSEGGQDGMLEYIFHYIGVTNKYFVELNWVKNEGAHTYNLQYKHNFTGLLLSQTADTLHDNILVQT